MARIEQDSPAPVILMGDFNAIPSGKVVRRILEWGMKDVFLEDYEFFQNRIDYIFIKGLELKVRGACIKPTRASDHPAVFALLELLK